MNGTSILERITSAGLTLSVSPKGDIEIIGEEEAVNNWLPIIRENKSAILAELDTSGKSCRRQDLPLSEPLQDLHPCKPCTPLEAGNVTETLPVTQQPFNECSTPVHNASAMRTHSEGKYSVTVTDASTDPILVDVTIAGQASFTLEIPKAYYDGLALLELLEQHNAQAAETHSVMSGLSKETEGIESRRAA